MKDKKFIVLIIVMLSIWIYFYIRLANFNPKSNDDELLDRINKLELKIDSLNSKKDSLRIVIDSTHVKIVTNEKRYLERVNTIINQSSAADSGFITDYIRLHKSKRDSTNIR